MASLTGNWTEKELNGGGGWNGAALRKARKEGYATQRELADRAGVSWSLVKDIERGAIKFTEGAGAKLWNAVHQLGCEFYDRNPQARERAQLLGSPWFLLHMVQKGFTPEEYVKGDQIRLEEQEQEIEELKSVTAKMLETIASLEDRLGKSEETATIYKNLFAKLSEAMGTRSNFEQYLEEVIENVIRKGRE